jgi:hypothetical protein
MFYTHTTHKCTVCNNLYVDRAENLHRLRQGHCRICGKQLGGQYALPPGVHHF